MTERLPHSGGAADPEAAEEAREARKASDESVAVVRASAAKWQGGLAALLAVITGVSITTIGDTIQRVGETAGQLLAGLVLAAFVAAVCATYYSLRASGGMPRMRSTRQAPSTHQTAVSALNDLRAGIGLTMVALALFGLTTLFIWFAPNAEAEPTLVEIDGPDATCGALDLSSSPGYAIVTVQTGDTDDRDATVIVLDLSSAPQWVVVDSCE